LRVMLSDFLLGDDESVWNVIRSFLDRPDARHQPLRTTERVAL